MAKIAHVYAMTFIGRGLLSNLYQLPLPTPPMIFSPLFPEIIRQVHNTGALGFSEPALSTCSLAQIRKLSPAVQINIAEKQINALGQP